jgi:hypothetical protein
VLMRSLLPHVTIAALTAEASQMDKQVRRQRRKELHAPNCRPWRGATQPITTG